MALAYSERYDEMFAGATGANTDCVHDGAAEIWFLQISHTRGCLRKFNLGVVSQAQMISNLCSTSRAHSSFLITKPSHERSRQPSPGSACLCCGCQRCRRCAGQQKNPSVTAGTLRQTLPQHLRLRAQSLRDDPAATLALKPVFQRRCTCPPPRFLIQPALFPCRHPMSLTASSTRRSPPYARAPSFSACACPTQTSPWTRRAPRCAAASAA